MTRKQKREKEYAFIQTKGQLMIFFGVILFIILAFSYIDTRYLLAGFFAYLSLSCFMYVISELSKGMNVQKAIEEVEKLPPPKKEPFEKKTKGSKLDTWA